jgi:hypothetical protein
VVLSLGGPQLDESSGNAQFFAFVHHGNCRNPSLGLATKAKGLQGGGPSGRPGNIPHAPGSAKNVRE